MKTWLTPLRDVLDRAASPVDFFCRNDDVGWDVARLWPFIKLFTSRNLPLDLAVIPGGLDRAQADALRDVRAAGQVGLHQHGFVHVNHESQGRKCEFGPARRREQQRRDIVNGRRRLLELLGPDVDSVFTPPWNRCTRTTGECLAELGFQVLSRESRAEPLDVPGLCELPIRVDWFAHRKKVRLSSADFGLLLARSFEVPGSVGIMFHHAIMDRSERTKVAELLDLLADHDRARPRMMAELVEAGVRRSVVSEGAVPDG